MGDFQDFFQDFDGLILNDIQFSDHDDSAKDGNDLLIPGGADSTIGSPVDVGKWVNTSLRKNVDQKFKNQEVGNIVLDFPSFTIDTNSFCLIDSVKYYIVGVDNVGSQDEILLLTYIRDSST